MERIVLIGSNIAHSWSPRIHNHLFRRFGLQFEYGLMPMEATDVPAAIATMKLGGYRGANITSPHKLAAYTCADILTEEAKAIGALNTIVFERDIATGHNTDAAGFAKSLEGEAVLHSPFTAAILGAGGAAMAAVHVLRANTNMQQLVIYSRNAKRGVDAALRLNDSRITGDAIDNVRPADIVVHATPVGLAGSTGTLLTARQLDGTVLLYEMIYSPAATSLMLEAEQAGVRTIGGAAMFIGQALAAFRIWTGINATVDDLPEEMQQVIGKQ